MADVLFILGVVFLAASGYLAVGAWAAIAVAGFGSIAAACVLAATEHEDAA